MYHVEHEICSATNLLVSITDLVRTYAVLHLCLIIPVMIPDHLGIMLDARQALLFPKLCEYNMLKPSFNEWK